jgi:hypothetical protein
MAIDVIAAWNIEMGDAINFDGWKAYYHLFDFLPSCLLSKNVNIEISEYKFLSFVFIVVKTGGPI